MNTKLMMIGALAVAFAGREMAAMPTKVETLRSEPTVQKLMASDLAAIKSGAKTRAEVASVAIKLAEETDSEAEKLLLMKGAFSLYVRSGEFDRAVETIEALQTAIPDIPDENVVSIITTSLRNISRSEGKLLYAFLDDIKAGRHNADGGRNNAATKSAAPIARRMIRRFSFGMVPAKSSRDQSKSGKSAGKTLRVHCVSRAASIRPCRRSRAR